MDILSELEKLRRDHYECDEDYWYSCPKAEQGCGNDNKEDVCTCGADRSNAILDSIIQYLKDNNVG